MIKRAGDLIVLLLKIIVTPFTLKHRIAPIRKYIHEWLALNAWREVNAATPTLYNGTNRTIADKSVNHVPFLDSLEIAKNRRVYTSNEAINQTKGIWVTIAMQSFFVKQMLTIKPEVAIIPTRKGGELCHARDVVLIIWRSRSSIVRLVANWSRLSALLVMKY